MERTIIAIYERGVLRPTRVLDLPERETVHVKIQSPRSSNGKRSQGEYARALRVLQANGLIKPKSRTVRRRVSEKRRRALVHALSAGKPLSKIVIDDRD